MFEMEMTLPQADQMIKDLTSQLIAAKQERTTLREALRAIRSHINDPTICSEECLYHITEILDTKV